MSGVANALRAARPLQALTMFPSIRAILKCFAYAIWSLASILSILAFFLVLFGLTAMQVHIRAVESAHMHTAHTRARATPPPREPGHAAAHAHARPRTASLQRPLTLVPPPHPPSYATQLYGQSLRFRCHYNHTELAADFYYNNCDPASNGRQCTEMFPGWEDQATWQLPLLYDVNGTVVTAVEYEAEVAGYWLEAYGNNGTLMEPRCEDGGSEEEDYKRRRIAGDVYHFDNFGWT